MSTGSLTPNSDPDMPSAGPGSRLRRRVFLFGFLLLTIVVLVIARAVLLPFLFAIVVAYVLSPVVDAAERRRPFGRTLPRWAVVVMLYVALIGSTVTVIAFSVPRLASELTRLAREVPRIAAQAREEWIPVLEERVREVSARYLGPVDHNQTSLANPQGHSIEAKPSATEDLEPTPGAIQIRQRNSGGYEVVLPPHGIRVVPEGEHGYRITAARPRNQDRDLVATLNEMLGNVMQSTQNSAVVLFNTAKAVASSLSRGIFGLVMTLMVSAYMLITSDRIFDFFRSLYRPGKRHEFDDLVRRLDRGLAGVVRGQLIICLVNGVLSGIGFGLLGLKYWTFLTIVATIMSIVPIFGSILSTVPAVIVALPQGIGLALLVLAWVVAIHQLEANFLNPKIMGDAARVHPVLVVFALLAGEHLAGITGALLAVPTLSITQTLFFHLRERFLGVPRPISAPPSGHHKALAEAAASTPPSGKRNSNDPLPSSE
jgi:predicted PurR-regulated permease PerM